MSHFGNYHPSFELGERKSILSRFNAFLSKVGRRYGSIFKNALVGLFLGSMLIISSCKPQQIIVEKEKLVYVHSDSVRYIDSTVLIPKEVYRDYASLLDTLFLKTSISESWSVVDTNQMLLVGEIKNIKAIQIKYIEKEKVIKNDSIIEKEVPKPYPVVEEKKVIPTFAWICIIWSILSIVLLGVWVYLKFAKPI